MRMTELKSYRPDLKFQRACSEEPKEKMRNIRTRRILRERERERNYHALEGTYRVSHSSPSTAEDGEGQSIRPRTKIHSKQVVTCPEPGPHSLATVIIEDKKEKRPLVRGRQYIIVEYGYSL